jgi:hypothetical protein
LAAAEKYMLAWAESDAGFKIDEKVIADLAFLHSIVIVGAGAIALVYADSTNAMRRGFYAGSVAGSDSLWPRNTGER